MFIYFVRGNELIKIGFSIDPVRRLLEMQVGSPVELELLAVMPGDFEMERQLHARFREYRSHGEWFRLSSELEVLIQDTCALYGGSQNEIEVEYKEVGQGIFVGDDIKGMVNGWRLEQNSNGYFRFRWQKKDSNGKPTIYQTNSGAVGYKRGSYYLPLKPVA